MKTKKCIYWPVLIIALVSCLLLAGCGDSELKQTKDQGRNATVSEEVLKLLVAAQGQHYPELLSQNTESGAVAWCKTTAVVRDVDGAPIIKPDGTAQTVTREAIGKSNSMRDIGGGKTVRLVIAGTAFEMDTGALSKTDAMTGLQVAIMGEGVASEMNAEFAGVWANKTVNEKAAILSGVTALAQARIGGTVDIINALGEQVTGVLTAIGQATPWGAAAAAVDATVKTPEGETVVGKMIQPIGG